MNVKRPVTPEIIIGDQPSEEDLLECKYEGCQGVVDLRANDREPEQPLSTKAEGDECTPWAWSISTMGWAAHR